MSLPVVLRPEARAEFDDAFDWYEQQRPGLGVDFVTQVQETFDRISATPERYAQIFHDIRRVVVRRFPYSIFYKVEAQQVVVLAVFHSRRNPRIWQERA
jgi:plasmid stabilization system protein ParE